MATKLEVWNEALRILSQSALATVTPADEKGRVLEGAWNSVIRACYEVGSWNFLLLRAILARHGSAPVFGYRYYYILPTDFARVVEISETGVAHDPLLRYQLEAGKIATDVETVYLRYVSSNIAAITPGDWTQNFADFVSAELALRCAPKINASALELADGLLKSRRIKALSIDAIQNPPAQRQAGRWALATRGSGRRSQEQGR